MVVRLFSGVHATARLPARLGWREFLESRGHDRIQLLVLAPVGHHLVSVRAHKFALQTMEVRRLVLTGTYTWRKKKTTLIRPGYKSQPYYGDHVLKEEFNF